MLSRLDLAGHRLGLQLYPERDHSVLIGALTAQGEAVDTVLPYVYTRRRPTPTSSPRSMKWRKAASTPPR
jgi:hypothetical protein